VKAFYINTKLTANYNGVTSQSNPTSLYVMTDLEQPLTLSAGWLSIPVGSGSIGVNVVLEAVPTGLTEDGAVKGDVREMVLNGQRLLQAWTGYEWMTLHYGKHVLVTTPVAVTPQSFGGPIRVPRVPRNGV
jgi:hypothetical protein